MAQREAIYAEVSGHGASVVMAFMFFFAKYKHMSHVNGKKEVCNHINRRKFKTSAEKAVNVKEVGLSQGDEMRSVSAAYSKDVSPAAAVLGEVWEARGTQVHAVVGHVEAHLHKQAMHTSALTGQKWVDELLLGTII